MPKTVNIVVTGTLAVLQGGQPYGSDYYDQFAVDTVADDVYRINNSGQLVGPLGSTTYTPPVITLNHTGATVPATGFVATDNLEVYRDGFLQFPSTYTKGAGIITPTIPSDDESWYIKKV